LSYIGNTPALNYVSFAKQVFTIVNSQTAYTLDHKVTNENDIRLVINNVVQEPGSGKAYTASGTTLTLSAALVNGTDEMYCVFLGKAVQTVNPPNASVGSAQIADDLISGKTALGATPADTDELLISDAGTLKRVDYSYLKSANTPAFSAKATSQQSISNETFTDVDFGTEVFDTDSAFASNVFTVPSGEGGKYYLFAQAGRQVWDSDRFLTRIVRTPSGGSGDEIAVGETHDGEGYETTQVECIFQLTAGDVIKIQVWHNSGSTRNISSGVRTVFQGYKIIE